MSANLRRRASDRAAEEAVALLAPATNCRRLPWWPAWGLFVALAVRHYLGSAA